MKRVIDKIEPISVFLFFSLLGVVLFLFAAPLVGQKIIDWVVMENNPNFGTLDYFKLIPYSQHLSDIYFYGVDQYYPPLSYLPFYYILKVTTLGGITDVVRDVPYCPYQIWIFVMYNIGGAVWLCGVVNEYNISAKKKGLLLVTLFCSTPMFAGAIERGNPAWVVLLLLLTSIAWKDSTYFWKREAAMIMIAIAAGLKVYPALLGLLYVKEKRWKECIRLLIYGLLFFFVPFIWFGGVKGIERYISLLLEYSARDFGPRIEFFKGVLAFWGISGQKANIMNLLFMVILVVGFLCSKNKSHALFFFAFFEAFVPSNAFRYTLIYLIIPLLVMFMNTQKLAREYVYAILLGNIFTIPTLMGIFTHFELNFGIYSYTYVEKYIYVFAWLLLLTICSFEIYDWVIVLRDRRKKN